MISAAVPSLQLRGGHDGVEEKIHITGVIGNFIKHREGPVLKFRERESKQAKKSSAVRSVVSGRAEPRQPHGWLREQPARQERTVPAERRRDSCSVTEEAAASVERRQMRHGFASLSSSSVFVSGAVRRGEGHLVRGAGNVLPP